MIRSKIISSFKHTFDEDEIKWIKEKIEELLSDETSYLSTGKYCEEFERELSRLLGIKYCFTTNSGTGALELVYQAIGLNENDEVIVPTYTYPSTITPIVRMKAVPVLVDCTSYKDPFISAELVEKSITERTKAVVVVSVGGYYSYEISKIRELCNKYNLYLIEDMAFGLGTKFYGHYAGTIGDISIFSFFTTKPITTGEGGAIITDDNEIAERIKFLKEHMLKAPHYEPVSNWNMSEFQAIIGLAQLKNLDKRLERRSEIARIYKELVLKENIPIRTIDQSNVKPNYIKSFWVCDRLFFDNRRLYEEMKVKGIRLGGFVWEYPCHLQPFIKLIKHRVRKCPIAEWFSRHHFCLPIYPQLTREEIEYVVKILAGCIG